MVKENIAGLQISVNDSQPRILMKIKKPTSNPYYDVKALLPIQ